MNVKVETLARDLQFPEGPAFHPDGTLWFVDLQARSLVRWDGEVTHYPTDGVPNGAAFDRAGRLWFCDAERNAIRSFEPSTQTWRTVVDALEGEPLGSPNDLAFDARGSLIFTCPGGSEHRPSGYVCCLSATGDLTRIAGGLFFPNGLALTDEGESLVVAETHRHRLWKGAWDADARRWLEPKPWAEVGGPVGPDGMALGADGRLYVAVFGSGRIKAVGEQGEVVRQFDLPGKNPTNVAFDPSGRLGLVVTETERGELLSLPELGLGAAMFGGD